MTSLFEYIPHQRSQERVDRVAKSQKFRLQIRKRQKDELFRSVRKQLTESLKNLQFLGELKEEKDNLVVKIEWVIKGLESGMNNASFYQEINEMNLQPYLFEVILNNDIGFKEKTKVLHSLVQLTYFSCKIPGDFIDNNNFIDYFRKNISKINLSVQIQSDFTYYSSALLQNLTWYENKQFNYYMMESDLLPTLHKLIDQGNLTEKQKQNSLQIRKNLLCIYGNLFKTNYNEVTYIGKVLSGILNDRRNSENQQLLYETLKCLYYSVKTTQLWNKIGIQQEQHNSFFNIEELMDEITNPIQIIHHLYFSERCFVTFVSFLSELYDVNQYFADNIVTSFQSRFFLNALKKMRQNEQSSDQTKLSICKTIKLISKIGLSYSQCIYNNALQQQQLIQNLMARYMIINKNYGRYTIRIFIKMLNENKCIIDNLLDHGIIQVIKDLLDYQFYHQQKILIIQLVQTLIMVEEQLRNKNQQGNKNKIVTVLYDQGIIKDIQLMQDQNDVKIYKKAQKFMDKLSQIYHSDKFG